jgi:polyhydroxyalkanoate synthesis regulator phasin
MFEMIKKGLLTGLGLALITKEKLDAKLKKLVDEGKISQAEAEKMLTELLESGENYWGEMEDKIKQKVQETMEDLDLCTRKDLDELKKDIARLKERVTELETGDTGGASA